MPFVQDRPPRLVAVVGASGELGSRIVRQLLAAGVSVRAVARTREKLSALEKDGATLTMADVRRPATLAPALAGAQVVVTTANAILSKEPGNDLARVDGAGNRALVDAALAAGVSKLVFVSVRAPGAGAGQVDFFRTKVAAEDYLTRSGLPYVILRCGPFMEVWGQLLGGPVLLGKPVTVFGRGQNPTPYVAGEDVARIAAGLALDESLHNAVVDVAGPENLTPEEVVQTYERLAGQRVKRRHLPRPVMRLMAKLLRPVNPVISRLIAASLWGDSAEVRFEAGPLEARFGKLLRLEEFARRQLKAHQAASRPAAD